ncbi:MAG: hypothetical protein LBL13_08615 [Bacteroidales bacterium]|jgi:hypothetical protein|nr:hypothetical protein [Bacteroidales bacterium]
MNILFIGIIIGIVAGALDALPMIIKKLDRKDTVSSFVQWFFASIVIALVDIPEVAWWLEGSIIGVALAIPIVIIVSKTDKKSVPVILITSIVLGALAGVAIHFLTEMSKSL